MYKATRWQINIFILVCMGLRAMDAFAAEPCRLQKGEGGSIAIQREKESMPYSSEPNLEAAMDHLRLLRWQGVCDATTQDIAIVPYYDYVYHNYRYNVYTKAAIGSDSMEPLKTDLSQEDAARLQQKLTNLQIVPAKNPRTCSLMVQRNKIMTVRIAPLDSVRKQDIQLEGLSYQKVRDFMKNLEEAGACAIDIGGQVRESLLALLNYGALVQHGRVIYNARPNNAGLVQELEIDEEAVNVGFESHISGLNVSAREKKIYVELTSSPDQLQGEGQRLLLTKPGN